MLVTRSMTQGRGRLSLWPLWLTLAGGLAACGGGDAGPPPALAVGTTPAPQTSAMGLTQRPLDLGIVGAGLLVLQSGEDAPYSYSRLGRLDVDHQGQLIHSDGARVGGWPDAEAPADPQTLVPLPAAAREMAPLATTRVQTEMNFDVRLPVIVEDPWQGFDPRDPLHYNKATTILGWAATGEALPLTLFIAHARVFEPGPCGDAWTIRVTVRGQLASTVGSLCFDIEGLPDGSRDAVMHLPAGDAGLPQAIDIDFSATTQFGAPFFVTGLRQDGHARGQLVEVQVAADGLVTQRYDNRQVRSGGRVALARFTVADRLLRQAGSGSSWLCQRGCTPPALGAPGKGLLGSLQPGALNTDY